MYSSVSSTVLLVIGFGFVIFWHELGHFLAAKWADVKVEQFAVGFGQALLAWRKGLGLKWGSTQDEYLSRLRAHLDKTQPGSVPAGEDLTDIQLAQASAELGISETEYRLNWIPLGGYVKMLGQDDLKPGAIADDPRAYNNRPIGKRMIIVSAGVVMNVLLAAIGFMAIFLWGFKAPAARVGNLMPGSPAQNAYKLVDGKKVPAPLRVGDRILYLDDKWQSDFTKITLNVALLQPDRPVPVYVRHPDGSEENLLIEPLKSGPAAKDFLAIGIQPGIQMQAADVMLSDDAKDPLVVPQNIPQLNKGEVVVAVEGQSVKPDEFWNLDAAVQRAAGKPVNITVRNQAGKTRPLAFDSTFIPPFGDTPLNFLGMETRAGILMVQPKSAARGKMLPGDVVTAVAAATEGGDRKLNPTGEELRKWFNQAGQTNTPQDITVLRNGQTVVLKNITHLIKVEQDRYGLGVGLGYDTQNTVVAAVLPGSPAALAGIPAGAHVTAINSQPVRNWFDVNRLLREMEPGAPVRIDAEVDGQTRTFNTAALTAEQLVSARQNRFVLTDLTEGQLEQMIEIRKAANPLQAVVWGVGETRDSILQVYVTMRRMISGDISYKQVSGPVGIFTAGYRFAEKGTTWLIWFLSIISANLAVMNFLPIPIVDGGLFTFLIIEKLKGGPVSPRIQAVAQIVGLALLFSVFVLATYQDIARLSFMH